MLTSSLLPLMMEESMEGYQLTQEIVQNKVLMSINVQMKLMEEIDKLVACRLVLPSIK
jgi:hypothetical protein